MDEAASVIPVPSSVSVAESAGAIDPNAASSAAERLPADVSPPVLQALFHLCTHVQHGGSFAVDKAVVRTLLLAFADIVGPAAERFVAAAHEALGDKAALQLLFDVNVLTAVLKPSWAAVPATGEPFQHVVASLVGKVGCPSSLPRAHHLPARGRAGEGAHVLRSCVACVGRRRSCVGRCAGLGRV